MFQMMKDSQDRKGQIVYQQFIFINRNVSLSPSLSLFYFSSLHISLITLSPPPHHSLLQGLSILRINLNNTCKEFKIKTFKTYNSQNEKEYLYLSVILISLWPLQTLNLNSKSFSNSSPIFSNSSTSFSSMYFIRIIKHTKWF